MAKACDFCTRTNSYICNQADHCGLCRLGDTREDNNPDLDLDLDRSSEESDDQDRNG